MKKRKLLSILVLTSMVASIVLAAVVPSVVMAAGENWLTGWNYRRTVVLDTGTAASDYPVKITVSYDEDAPGDYGNPVSLSWIQQFQMATSWDPYGHSQGACVDSTGTYLYWSTGDTLTKTLVSSPSWSEPLARRTNCRNDGTFVDQINGICEVSGTIYASGIVFVTTPYRFFVKKYNAATLAYLGEEELSWSSGGDTQEALAYNSDTAYFYSVKFNDADVDIYDSADWSLVTSSALPGQPLGIQGAAWFNGQFWVSTTAGPIRVYDYNTGTHAFTYVVSLTHPVHVLNGQSFGFTPDGHYIYMGDATTSYEYLHKIKVNWTSLPSVADVYLNEHCRSDFGDVRFTTSDGSTELDYWLQEYTASDEAIFWVEIPTVPASSAVTIYTYYGKSDGSTTSDGGATFEFFDDFPGVAIDTEKWDGDTGSAVVADSIMTLSGLPGGWKIIYSIPQFGEDVALVAELKNAIPADYYSRWGVKSGDHWAYGHVDKDAFNLMYTKDGTTLDDTNTNWPTNSYFVGEMYVLGATSVTWYIDGTAATGSPTTSNIPNSSTLEVYLGAYQADNLLVDSVAVYSLVAVPPVVDSAGSEESLDTFVDPIVVTGLTSEQTSTSATVSGTLTSLGDATNVYVYFQYGVSLGYGSSTAEDLKTAVGSFSVGIAGLGADTLYYYRAVGRYIDDTATTSYVYGAAETFSALASVGAPGVDPPDILRIDDVKVYSGYLEDGDQLYVIDYRLIYNEGTPIIDVGDYFDFVLYDGVIVRAKIPVKSWGHRPGSIYLQADASLAWGGYYTLKLIGNPNKWGTVPSDEWALTGGDWQGSDLAQLDIWVIAVANLIQADYDVQLVDFAEGMPYLTDQGAVIFNMGIPGLCNVRRNLCSPYYVPGYSDTVDRDIPAIDTEERVGTQIYGASTDVAVFFGMDDVNIPGALVFGGGFLVIAILLGAALGRIGPMSGLAGIGIASPILVFGAWLGFVPFPLIIIIASICVVYTVFTIWVKGV